MIYWFIGFLTSKQLNHLTIKPFNNFIILSSIIIAILSVIYFPLVATRLTSQSIPEVRSVEERINGYSEAWQLFKQQPVLGVGAGNYTLALFQQDPSRPGWEYQPVHNMIVLFAVEQGIVGILLFLLVILSFIIFQISNGRYQLSGNCGSCYLLFVICYLIFAGFDHYLYSSYVGLMLLAVFLALSFNSKQNNTSLV